MVKNKISPISRGKPLVDIKAFVNEKAEEKPVIRKAIRDEKQARLTVNVPADTYKKLRAKALNEGTDVTKLVNQWVKGYLGE